MANANYIFLLSLTVIFISFLIKKAGILSEDDGKVIAKVVLNVTLPALILEVFSNIEIYPTLVLLPFIAFGFSLLVSAFTYVSYRKYPMRYRGLMMMVSVGFNIGLFAYPLIRGIWGEIGMEYIIMFDLGNSFVVFILSYTLGSFYSPKIKPHTEKFNAKTIIKRVFSSVPLITLFIALIINLSGIILPLLLTDLLDILSRANMALTLLTLGIFIDFQFDKSHWKYVIQVLFTRYGFGLLVGIPLLFVLPFGLEYNALILVGLILPIGMSSIPFAVEFGYDEKLASTMVNLTNIFSFILMWIIVLILGIG
ncbi:MAG: AEC family transporter [Candidatus Lokiarchaeota archaeon]|nr:AEC family transporter [Candidatus Lokiarchaeota archaeon]